MNASSTELISILHADKPATDRAEKLQLYGRFIGDWDARVITHAADGARHEASGEIHFGWILQGRGIQDVWMTPRLAERANASPLPVAGNWYGTTLRIYDPNLDAWRIYWIDPATNSFRQQIGRPCGNDIVQEGKTEQGELTQPVHASSPPATAAPRRGRTSGRSAGRRDRAVAAAPPAAPS